MAFLRDAFAEMLENTTDVFTTAISRLPLPEDCEANVSLKANSLLAIAGVLCVRVWVCAPRLGMCLQEREREGGGEG